MDGKRVDQLIGEEEAGDAVGRKIFQSIHPRDTTGLVDPRPDRLLLLCAHRCAAFDEDIPKACTEVCGSLLAGLQKIARQQSLSRPHLYHGEWIRMTKAGIELLGLFGQGLSENGMYVGTRIEITRPSDPFLCWIVDGSDVIAVLRMIEGELHETSERNRTHGRDFSLDIRQELRMPSAQSDTTLVGSRLLFQAPSRETALLPDSLGKRGG